jgi:P4 family phage/plasmid primase-like protien
VEKEPRTYNALVRIFGVSSIDNGLRSVIDFTNGDTQGKITKMALKFLIAPWMELRIDTTAHLLPVRPKLVIDLRTGVARPRTREDYFSEELEVEWKPDADTAVVDDLFLKLQSGNRARADYLKRIMGYCSMLAANPEQKFVILSGPKDSGKSTLLDLIDKLMGPMSLVTRKELFIGAGANTSAEGPQAFMCQFDKMRFIYASEFPDGAVLAADVVKCLTQRKATFRGLHQTAFRTIVTFTVVIDTNYVPTCDGSDTALFKRLVIIEFNSHFVPHGQPVDPSAGRYEKVPEFVEWFEEAGHMPALLKYLVEGAKEYYANKTAGIADRFATPSDVVGETTDFADELDDISRFLNGCTVAQKDSTVGATDAYQRYGKWCSKNGVKKRTQTSFGSALRSRRIVKKRASAGFVYTGIALTAPEQSQ